MAITLDYVSVTGTEGNDYSGATFTDGAFTVADMTLTKAGAFAASKANHYLYLTDNGSGRVTAGYYKIASVTSANAVVLATSPKSGATDPVDVKCTQAAGTTLLPWRSLQGAFDLLTRNATDGNQVNLKAGTAHVNAAALDLATFIAGGALFLNAPLIVRGYTAAANDGGVGEIDCNGATMWAATTYDYVTLADLKIHTFGDNDGIVLDSSPVLYRVEVYKGASAPNDKSLFYCSSSATSIVITGCYFHDAGTNGAYCIRTGNSANLFVVGNHLVVDGATGRGISTGLAISGAVMSNVVLCDEVAQVGLYVRYFAYLMNNAIYNSAAGTAQGIWADGSSVQVCINNIVEGWSGAGGEGLYFNGVMAIVGHNAFYNCTSNYVSTETPNIDLTANDVALAASPFTDAANGDFSLTAAGKTALRGLGWPAAYLGAHANTDGHVTIGAVQYGEAESGGGMLQANKRGNKQ
jgi:hypothetical protein